MTLFRFRFKVLGGHTHVRLFAGRGSLSLGKCGDLVFRNDEWQDLVERIKGPGSIEILPEEEHQTFT